MTNQQTIPNSSATDGNVAGDFVTFLGETYYRITNYDAMPPFFMTIVSSDDHWLFISTTGGLTAGRINSDHALFPYYTDDRVTENADNTGSKTIIQVNQADGVALWECFTDTLHQPYRLQRNLYKNVIGTSLIFEEINLDLGLTFRYAWRTSAKYGIVKTSWLVNSSDNAVSVTVTDGLQNVLPSFVDAQTQNAFSVLLDAYKRSEVETETGLGMFALSSRLTDVAEPSEALQANTIWQIGLESPTVFLSSKQLPMIRKAQPAQPQTDVRGQRGAYFVQATIELTPNDMTSWHFVAEVDQNGADVVNLLQHLKTEENLYELVEQDIHVSSEGLNRIVGSADGLQISGDPLATQHHFANVLYNVMRGGTFADQYHIEKQDLVNYIHTHDRQLAQQQTDFFAGLPDQFTVQTLKQHADQQDNIDLTRLCYSYLPLTFSRRHGDPSRPWNRFSIYLKNDDGSPRLNYEGNWRDIFQNWEALVYAYPEFIEGMLAVFLNATTLDGYNPYRVTRDGIDWEVPEPDNPWANIGYWSDHQIIYLQKLMEVCERFYPDTLQGMLTRRIFASANVPYLIKPYDDIIQDAYNSIDFDWDAEHKILERVQQYGTDGKLIWDADGNIFHTTLTEKLLNLLLAKLANFVPDGGIWMNTQRPEWNDANNALVGKGISVVTTNYLRRFVVFFRDLIADMSGSLAISTELYQLFDVVHETLKSYATTSADISDAERRAILDALGQAGSTYRWQLYDNGVSNTFTDLTVEQLNDFLLVAQQALDKTIHANRRDDALYHAYNTLSLSDGEATIRYLNLMLEGQVAVLSSGLLTPEQALVLLQNLRQSLLYREDQHSYILYPNKDLPGFLDKNQIDASKVGNLKLVQTLIDENNPILMIQDVLGHYHFSGNIRNANDLRDVLDTLAQDDDLADLVASESDTLFEIFEDSFQHDQFTGRSGSFFAYEGFGSIYWHMVSKLLLAVQETVYLAQESNSDTLPALIDAYYDVRAGLGFNKTPQVYGAFPLDPYSHSPANQGAKQPGMTGMVKEEILTRLGELGIVIEHGTIEFNPVLLRDVEWLNEPMTLAYYDVAGDKQQLDVPADALALTLCRVPIILQKFDAPQWQIELPDGTTQTVTDPALPADLSEKIFSYSGDVCQITVNVN